MYTYIIYNQCNCLKPAFYYYRVIYFPVPSLKKKVPYNYFVVENDFLNFKEKN